MMKYKTRFLLSILGLSFLTVSAHADQCSIIFRPAKTAEDLIKVLTSQLSAKELKEIKEEVVDLESPAALRSLKNSDWGEISLLSNSEAVNYSLRPQMQSFRLQPSNTSESAPSLHFIYRDRDSMGRLVGPRFVLTHVILGPYNLNRIDLNAPSLEILDRQLIKVLFQWSREREPEISTVGYREIGL
jgi:hypothetical protein